MGSSHLQKTSIVQLLKSFKARNVNKMSCAAQTHLHRAEVKTAPCKFSGSEQAPRCR